MRSIMSISLPRGTPLNDRHEVIRKNASKAISLPEITIQFDPPTLTFKPKCGCPHVTIGIHEIPLEDFSCECGRTQLIKYLFTDE